MSHRSSLAGACAAVSLIATATGIFVSLCPTESAFGPIARMMDPYSHGLFAFGALFAVLTVALGGRVVGSGLVIAATISGALLFQSYRNLSVPPLPDHTPEFRVLFFNALATNTGSSGQIVAAAIKAEPDIVVFAEAAAVVPSLEQLRQAYQFVSPCDEGACELLVATNLDVIRFWQLQLNPIWSERYAVLEFERPAGGSAFLAASHLAKPWMSGVSEAEIDQLKAQYNWLKGPVVVVGDYNMAPWSLPMRGILKQTDLRTLRGQHTTWPVSAGLFGIPIDQLLVRGGARAVHIEKFGDGLNSNHLGFVADIAIQPPTEP